MLNKQTFKIVIKSSPLISIDLLVKKNNKILLGKRVNKPALGYFFTTGGRIYKNESIQKAIFRIAKSELNIDLKFTPKFLNVFEHFYADGIYDDVSTHYVNLAYELNIDDEALNLPTQQHSEYCWFEVDELLHSKQVHKHVKDYFRSGYGE